MTVGGSEGRFELDRLEALLEAFSRVRLLVVGDVVLDDYLWGAVERVSPEAPVPVVHVERESVMLGGAGNVVRNVISLGARCTFCTVVGEDPDGGMVRALLKDLGVDTAGVVRAADRPTTRKTRVIARSQQVVRFDRESHRPLEVDCWRRVADGVRSAVGEVAGLVLQDYGKGLFAPERSRQLLGVARGAGVPVYVDPKSDLESFRGAAVIKPNLREAEAVSGLRGGGAADLDAIGERLRGVTGDADIVLSRGPAGLSLFRSGRPRLDVPTAPQEVFDVQGAGDTTIAVLALAVQAGASLPEAAVLANAAAGVVVEKVGTAVARPCEVRERLPAAIAAAEETP